MVETPHPEPRTEMAISPEEHCRVCGVTGWDDGEKCYRPYCPHNAAPDPNTLRPGENDTIDTHQDTPFGAGGQESGR